jgi:hypothetical protein
MMRKLDEGQCKSAIAMGDFGEDVRNAAPHVAVVLTQSWCPQWTWMRKYLDAVAAAPDTTVFWVEYDRERFFDELRTFKEDSFGNREIPYVRYYRNGALAHESNYIDRGGFERALR